MPASDADGGEQTSSGRSADDPPIDPNETARAPTLLDATEVLRLLCEEIDTFRKRQITTFRQFVIVIGAIVLVVSPLDLDEFREVRIVGGCVCLLTGVMGWLIILSYRSRIHYERIRRQQFLAGCSMPLMPFYPVRKRDQVIPGYQGPWVTRALSTPLSVLWASLLKRVGATCRPAMWALSSRVWLYICFCRFVRLIAGRPKSRRAVPDFASPMTSQMYSLILVLVGLIAAVILCSKLQLEIPF